MGRAEGKKTYNIFRQMEGKDRRIEKEKREGLSRFIKEPFSEKRSRKNGEDNDEKRT